MYDVPWNHVASELVCLQECLKCCDLANTQVGFPRRHGVRAPRVVLYHLKFFRRTPPQFFLPKARGMLLHDFVINSYGGVQHFHPNVCIYILYIYSL